MIENLAIHPGLAAWVGPRGASEPTSRCIRARYRGPADRRGLALVTVLWMLMLLALIAASFTRTTRTEINLARKYPGWA